MKTLFENITILFEDGRSQSGQYLSYEGRYISYVGDKRPHGEFDRVINGDGKLLIPGLYNTHTHSPMTVFRGMAEDLPLQRWLEEAIFPAEDRLSDDIVRAGTSLACAEQIAGGIVSMSDMYFFCDTIAQMVGESGMKGNICRSIVSTDESDPSEDIRVRQSCELFEKYHNSYDGRIKIDMSLHSEYANTRRFCEYTAQLAQRLGTGFQIHLSETEKEHAEALDRRGMTPTAFFEKTGVLDSRTTAAHCVWLTEEDMDILRAHNATVSVNTTSNLKLGSGVVRLAELRERGVRIALGTDGAASNNTLDIIKEMNMTALVQRGFTRRADFPPAASLIPAATVNGAYAQGREDCGRLAAGYRADLAVIDMTESNNIPSYSPQHSLVFSSRSSDVIMTVADGEVLYENGEMKTLDMEKIRYDIAKYKF